MIWQDLVMVSLQASLLVLLDVRTCIYQLHLLSESWVVLTWKGGHALMQYFHIDNPLDAFAVHAGAGATGVLACHLIDRHPRC